MKVDVDDIRTPDVEELGQTSRLYTLHCGVELNEDQSDGNEAATGASHEMTYADKQNHHLWLKSKASRYKHDVSLSVCLNVCLSVCLSVCLCVCLPACLPACLSACLSVKLYIND